MAIINISGRQSIPFNGTYTLIAKLDSLFIERGETVYVYQDTNNGNLVARRFYSNVQLGGYPNDILIGYALRSATYTQDIDVRILGKCVVNPTWG